MPIYPQTQSVITGPSGRNTTHTSLSTNIIIKVGANPVGAIQNISITESREIAMIDEVGTDGHIDSVPSQSTNITGSCTRTRFDRLRMTEAFGRDFLHIHAMRIPFDIDIYDTQLGDGGSAIITTIKNVWINQVGYKYEATNFVIVDDMQFKAETIYSILNGGNAATGGERGANIMQLNSIERQADIGKRRGSLDSPGLLNDFFSNV